MSDVEKHDPWAALRVRDFSYYISARFFLTLAVQIQSVVVGLQIYRLTPGDKTDKAFAMGLVGLAEAIPFITLAIFAGHVADVIKRRRIIIRSIIFLLICTWVLFYISFDRSLLISLGTIPIYGIIFCTGIARGFLGPVFPAFQSQLVPRKLYANASTWNGNLWMTAAVLGPTLGSLMFGMLSAHFSYGVSATLITVSLVLMFFVHDHPLPPREAKEKLSQSLTAGFRFVFSNQVMLSALSLDLFAVLFGGAMAMMPVFTHDVWKLEEHYADIVVGILRASVAAGSILMGLFLAYFPPTKKAGRNLFLAVIGYGISIIGFALAPNFYVGLLFLTLSGCCDMVSVVVRHTIMQLMIPDNMRGRVSAVNGIFIGSSNEIGEMESGIAAKLLGIIPSVIFGGCMTILVVCIVFISAPKLRKLNLDKLI